MIQYNEKVDILNNISFFSFTFTGSRMVVENEVANPVIIEQNISKPIRSEVADKETESRNAPPNTPRHDATVSASATRSPL